MVRIFIAFFVVSAFYACQPTSKEMISGKWQLDSVYYFYNGFDYSQPASEDESYQYFPDGSIIARYRDFEEKFQFTVDQTELKYLDEKGGLFSEFQILSIDEQILILKKVKMPVFGGTTDQERYEVRYFSKIPVEAV